MAYTDLYVRADAAGGGNGTTDTNSGANGAFTLAEAITHSASNTLIRYNVKGSVGTYANTTTTRTFNGVGLTTAPNWWRGYDTVIGDLDNNPSGTKPSITFTTGQFSVTGAHQIFSNLSISGAPTASLMSITAANVYFDRIRSQNTAANSASTAISIATGGNVRVTRSWFKATSTATRVVNISIGVAFIGCAVEGGGIGFDCGSSTVLIHNVLYDNGNHGINLNGLGNTMVLYGNSVYSAGGDGIRITAIPSTSIIADSIINEAAGYGINNNTGTNTNIVMRINNTFYLNTSGNENGFGDSPSLMEGIDSASSFVNAPGANMTTASTSTGYQGGMPGLFENESYTAYGDRGAVRHQDPGGGGGLALPAIRRGT